MDLAARHEPVYTEHLEAILIHFEVHMDQVEREGVFTAFALCHQPFGAKRGGRSSWILLTLQAMSAMSPTLPQNLRIHLPQSCQVFFVTPQTVQKGQRQEMSERRIATSDMRPVSLSKSHYKN